MSTYLLDGHDHWRHASNIQGAAPRRLLTFDNTDEGRKLAQYAKGGSTLIDAWFRAAKEIQPATNGVAAPDGPSIWVGAMCVGKNGSDPFNDHAWDFGSVSSDPSSPTWLAAMWTTC